MESTTSLGLRTLYSVQSAALPNTMKEAQIHEQTTDEHWSLSTGDDMYTIGDDRDAEMQGKLRMLNHRVIRVLRI